MTEILEALEPLLTALVGAAIAYLTAIGIAKRTNNQAIAVRRLELDAETKRLIQNAEDNG